MSHNMRIPFLCIAACFVVTACGGQNATEKASESTAQATTESVSSELNIYSARHYDSDAVMYAVFEDETGIKVNVREGKAPQLLELIKSEGKNSPADLVIASDAGTFFRFKSAGLLQPMTSDIINSVIDDRFRDPEGYWVGLTQRVRVIAYDPARVSEEDVDEYTDLADPKFKGEICMRSSTNIYNLSLMGEIIGRLGVEDASSWAEAVVSNFARDPKGGDTTQMESIAAGECSAAIVNHYYWVRLAEHASEAKRDVANKVKLSFPSFGETGTHVNVSAAAITANAPNAENARQFIEFLATPLGQELLTAETKDFPVISGAKLAKGIKRLPDFDQSDFSLVEMGENQSEAQKVFDRAGWN